MGPSSVSSSSATTLSLPHLSTTLASSTLTNTFGCSTPTSASSIPTNLCLHHHVALNLHTTPTYVILEYPCCGMHVHLHANGQRFCAPVSFPISSTSTSSALPDPHQPMLAFLGQWLATTGDCVLFFVKAHTCVMEDVYRIDQIHTVHFGSSWYEGVVGKLEDKEEENPQEKKECEEKEREEERDVVEEKTHVLNLSSKNGKIFGTTLQTWSAKVSKSMSLPTSISLKSWVASEDNLSEVNRMTTNMVSFLESGYFYYALQTDFSRPLQHRCLANHPQWAWKSVNLDFVWNAFMVAGYEAHIKAFIPPIIQGHIESATVTVPLDNTEKSQITLSILARRSALRAGLRYQRRGADHDGHVANFVETEQTIHVQTPLQDHVAAYLQLRGSVPLRWSQSGVAFHPEIHIDPDTGSQTRVFQRHLHVLQPYGTVKLLNLLNHQGRENVLRQQFCDVVTAMPAEGGQRVEYIEFDFHREVQPTMTSKLDELVEKLIKNNEETYFWLKQPTVQMSLQKGVIRTNCLDCLDRTNVVQTYIGAQVLKTQLHSMGFEKVPEELQKWHSLAWTQVGNAISQCYTGTDAMKTDYTMAGKRAIQGAAKDAKKSVTRYLKNQFQDHLAQLLIDVLLGYHSWFPTQHPFGALPSAWSMIYGTNMYRNKAVWLHVNESTCVCWVPSLSCQKAAWQVPLRDIQNVQVITSFVLRIITLEFGFQMHVLSCFGDPLVLEYPPFRAAFILNKAIMVVKG